MGFKILVTGTAGMLAPYLIERAKDYGVVITTARKNSDVDCDLSNDRSIKSMLLRVNPDVVIHAAGLTNIEKCENNFNKADESNHKTTANFVNHLNHSTQLVVISTDQVYPDNLGPHTEDKVGPVNNYGITKLAGENAAKGYKNVLILRTNMFGHSLTDGRLSIDDFIINSVREKKAITLFSDIYFSPLHMSTLSEIIFKMVDKKIKGIFNVGCRNGMSKADFGLAVINHIGLSTDTVELGSSDLIKGRVKRPHDMRLDVSRLENVLHSKMPTLLEEIAKL